MYINEEEIVNHISAKPFHLISEAAEELGVSPGRVDQLLDSGQLVAAYPTGKRMVTISSVNECKRSASRLDNLCRSVSDNS